jgi:RecA/RadA recombinase
MPKIIRTFISPVVYREPGGGLVSLPDSDGEPICWLDSLIGGGLLIPDGVIEGREPPLIWLVSGPPGTGKTTFAAELCYRLSTQLQADGPFDTVYFSAESPAARIGQNMDAFGWEDVIVERQHALMEDRPPPRMHVIGRETVANIGQMRPGDFFKHLPNLWADKLLAHVVVIDSLNVLPPEWKAGEMVEALQAGLTGRAWVLLLMQDWQRGEDPYFAFMADIETRFSEAYRKGYMLRAFRIVKMRHQEHAQGDHVVKICPKPCVPTGQGGRAWAERENMGLERQQGGVYILPSMHRHLSRGAKRVRTLPLGAIEAPVQGMGAIMPLGADSGDARGLHGFPRGRCTVLVGARGSLKSHVAYDTLLNALAADNRSLGVMFSLRDDEQAALETLKMISRQHGLEVNVEKLRDDGRLDIVYFWPGYITPEEFMHRVVVAIEGMIARHNRDDGSDIVAVLNGIDHLAARHPLCAVEEMFVPGLISYLRQHYVTSLVISATDEREPIAAPGLLPMADLLLRFAPAAQIPPAVPQGVQQVVEVTAQRVPAGGTSGKRGYLYRSPQEEGRLAFVAARADQGRIAPMPGA